MSGAGFAMNWPLAVRMASTSAPVANPSAVSAKHRPTRGEAGVIFTSSIRSDGVDLRLVIMGTTDAISPDVRDRNSVGDVHAPAYCPQLITKLGDQV